MFQCPFSPLLCSWMSSGILSSRVTEGVFVWTTVIVIVCEFLLLRLCRGSLLVAVVWWSWSVHLHVLLWMFLWMGRVVAVLIGAVRAVVVLVEAVRFVVLLVATSSSHSLLFASRGCGVCDIDWRWRLSLWHCMGWSLWHKIVVGSSALWWVGCVDCLGRAVVVLCWSELHHLLHLISACRWREQTVPKQTSLRRTILFTASGTIMQWRKQTKRMDPVGPTWKRTIENCTDSPVWSCSHNHLDEPKSNLVEVQCTHSGIACGRIGGHKPRSATPACCRRKLAEGTLVTGQGTQTRDQWWNCSKEASREVWLTMVSFTWRFGEEAGARFQTGGCQSGGDASHRSEARSFDPGTDERPGQQRNATKEPKEEIPGAETALAADEATRGTGRMATTRCRSVSGSQTVARPSNTQAIPRRAQRCFLVAEAKIEARTFQKRCLPSGVLTRPSADLCCQTRRP